MCTHRAVSIVITECKHVNLWPKSYFITQAAFFKILTRCLSFKNTLTFRTVSYRCNFIWKTLYYKNLGENSSRIKWRLAPIIEKNQKTKNQVEVGSSFYLISFELLQLHASKFTLTSLACSIRSSKYLNRGQVKCFEIPNICKSSPCQSLWNYIKLLMIMFKPI